jgi:uncharacterized membrane protein
MYYPEGGTTMVPFVVLLVALLGFRGLGLLGVSLFTTWQDCVPYALALFFVFTAGSRLTPMKEDLVKMVPKIFPYPRLLVYVTGGLELLGAIGLLIPATTSVAGFCLMALLIVMFPADVNAALKHITLRGNSPRRSGCGCSCSSFISVSPCYQYCNDPQEPLCLLVT